MIKNLRGLLNVFCKENAVAPTKDNKCRLLIFDKYLNKYVSADELLIPQTKISTTPSRSKISKDFFLFELLLKKFVNPKLDLLIRLPTNSDQSLQGYDCQKKQSFSTFGPRLFWKKKKNSAKKHGIPALPPVHDKINEDQSKPLKLGWAGQVTKKPLTDPRPENSRGGPCSGPGKGPKKNKPEQNKKNMVCKGNLTVINNQQESELPLFSKERFPVDDTLPIPQEKTKQDAKQIMSEKDNKIINTNKEIQVLSSSEKKITEKKLTDKNKVCTQNQNDDLIERKKTPCKKKTSTNSIKVLEKTIEKESNKVTLSEQDSTSRYLNKPAKRNIKKVCSKQTLRKTSTSPISSKTTKTKLDLAKENKTCKEKKSCWNEPVKNSADVQKTFLKDIGSFSMNVKICNDAANKQPKASLNIEKTQKSCATFKCLQKKDLCSTDPGQNIHKGLKGQGKFDFMVRPKTTDHKDTNKVGGKQCSSVNENCRSDTLKLGYKLDGECPENKPVCQNKQASISSKVNIIARPKSSNLPKGNLKENVFVNHENCNKNKKVVRSCDSSKPCVDSKDSNKKSKSAIPEEKCKVTNKSLFEKNPKTEQKSCHNQDLTPLKPITNKEGDGPCVKDRQKLSCPKQKPSRDTSPCLKVEPKTVEKLESFSHKTCVTKTQSDLKKCDEIVGFKVKKQVIEKEKPKQKKCLESSSGLSKRKQGVDSAEKSKETLKKGMIEKSQSSTDCSTQKISSKLKKSKSEPNFNNNCTLNKQGSKSKRKRSKSKTCSQAFDPENSKQKEQCEQNAIKIDKTSKECESKRKGEANESKTFFTSTSAPLNLCSASEPCEQILSDNVEHNTKIEKKIRESEICPDATKPKSVNKKVKSKKKYKSKVEKFEAKSITSKSCLTQNEKPNDNGKSKRSKSKTSSKSKKSSTNKKCSQEKEAKQKPKQSIGEENTSCKKIENADCCKMDTITSKITSKSESNATKHQCKDLLKDQSKTETSCPSAPFETGDKKVDGVKTKPCGSLNEIKHLGGKLSKDRKNQRRQCKGTTSVSAQKPKKVFKHAVVCTKSLSVKRIKKKPQTNIKASSAEEHLGKRSNAKNQFLNMKTEPLKLIGTKNQNEKSKRGKICSIQPLQKRINENPIKTSKNIQAKSFSQLKTVGSREQNQLVLYLKNNSIMNNAEKNCKQNQENESIVKSFSNQSPSHSNIFKPTFQSEESISKIIKPIPVTNSGLTNPSEQPKKTMKNKIPMLSRGSTTSVKNETLHCTVEEDKKKQITKLKLLNNHKGTTPYSQSVIPNPLKLNLHGDKTSCLVSKETVTDKIKTDVKRFGILTNFNHASVSIIKEIQDNISKNTNNSSFIPKSLTINVPSSIANKPTKPQISKGRIVDTYLSKLEQDKVCKVKILQKDQNTKTEDLFYPTNKVTCGKFLNINEKQLKSTNIRDLETLKNTSLNNNVNQRIDPSCFGNKASIKQNSYQTADTIQALMKSSSPEKSQTVRKPNNSLNLPDKDSTNVAKEKNKSCAVLSQNSLSKIKTPDTKLENKINQLLDKIENCRPASSQQTKTNKIITLYSKSISAENNQLNAPKPIEVANVKSPMTQNNNKTTLEKATKNKELSIKLVKNLPAESNNLNVHNSIKIEKEAGTSVTTQNKALCKGNDGIGKCSSTNYIAKITSKYKLNIPQKLDPKLNTDKITIDPIPVNYDVRNQNTQILESNKSNSANDISQWAKHQTANEKRKVNRAIIRKFENNSIAKSQNCQLKSKSLTQNDKSKDKNKVYTINSKTNSDSQIFNTLQNKNDRKKNENVTDSISQNQLLYRNLSLRPSDTEFKSSHNKNSINSVLFQRNNNIKIKVNNKGQTTKEIHSNQKKEIDTSPSSKEETTPQNNEVKPAMYKQINSRSLSNINIIRKNNRTIQNRALKLRASLKVPQKSKNMFAFKKKITLDSYKHEIKTTSSLNEYNKSCIQPSKNNIFQCAIKKPDKMHFVPLEESKKPEQYLESKNDKGFSVAERENKSNIIVKGNVQAKVKLTNSTLTVEDSNSVQRRKNENILSDKLKNLVELCVKKNRQTAKILPKP